MPGLAALSLGDLRPSPPGFLDVHVHEFTAKHLSVCVFSLLLLGLVPEQHIQGEGIVSKVHKSVTRSIKFSVETIVL